MNFILLLVMLLFVLLGSESVAGQKPRVWISYNDIEPTLNMIRWATPSDFNGSALVFCRGYYEQSRSEKGVWGWYVDYPGGDNNLLVRISELTKTKIRLDTGGYPLHVVVRLDGPLLFQCPVLFMSDVGTIGLTAAEVANIRLYIEKGGFLWADDFWGSEGLRHWEHQLRLVLPPESYVMIDIPAEHPIMNQLYRVPKIPQIPNIGFWYDNRGLTSERGEDSLDVHFRGMENREGRLVSVMTHNTDIADTWQIDGSDSRKEYFNKFSITGYAVGINIFLYALSH